MHVNNLAVFAQNQLASGGTCFPKHLVERTFFKSHVSLGALNTYQLLSGKMQHGIQMYVWELMHIIISIHYLIQVFIIYRLHLPAYVLFNYDRILTQWDNFDSRALLRQNQTIWYTFVGITNSIFCYLCSVIIISASPTWGIFVGFSFQCQITSLFVLVLIPGWHEN